MRLIREKIDYLTVRLPERWKLWDALWSLVDNSPQRAVEGFDGWRFFYDWVVDGWARHKVWVDDSNWNHLCAVYLRGYTEKKNQNFPSCIQFFGTFWTFYDKHVPAFLEMFGIPLDLPGYLLRLDYRYDVHLPVKSRGKSGVEFFCSSVVPPRGSSHGKWVRPRMMETLGHVTWWKRETERVELCFYDKRLDIEDEGLSSIEPDFYATDEFRYSDYLAMTGNVVRTEVRFNSVYFKNKPFTVAEVLCNANQLARKYLRTCFPSNGLFSVYLQDPIDNFEFAKILFGDWKRAIADIVRDSRLKYQKRNFESYARSICETLWPKESKIYFGKVMSDLHWF